MASQRRFGLLRLCAAVAVLMAPIAAWSTPALDTKELRAKLRMFEADHGAEIQTPVDVALLRAELGLTQTVNAPQPQTQAFEQTPLSNGQDGGLFALQTGQGASLPAIDPQQTRGQPVDVSTTNFRLMLATLSQTYSGVNNLSVMTAQGPRGSIALSVRSGTVTLSDVRAFFAAQGMPPRADGTLTAPLVLWPDATLRMSPGETLRLARDTGAFILSMGHIEADGVLIESVGPENPYEHHYAPFITVLGGGSLSMQNSVLRGLGFGRTVKFSGLSVARNPLMRAKRKVILRGNLFADIKRVSIAGARGTEITGNTFSDARSNVLNLFSAPQSLVRENLFRGQAPTNAIRVDQGSDYTDVAQNVFLRGSRVAILVDGNSNHVSVRDNLIWQRDGAGIKFLNTRCGLAEGNVLVDNRQKGIEVRKSDGVVVRQNLIAGNRSAGVWVSAQAEDAKTNVLDNTFLGNGAGLSAATGAEIYIAGNDLSRQMPKLLDGDIARLSTRIVRDLRGEASWRFNDGKAQQQNALAPLCGGNT